ncbi:MAG: nucleotide exchange factor GrpE, partial [Alphaproteobacteria bacterium]|nr:nucleotide exchange factor GrpE [Alphaproteobacteria bacterium]
IDPMGEKFDHNLHQAVAQAPHPDAPAGTVIQVVQAGYVIADRLLRPAMVVVSKAADEAKKVDTTA